MSGAKAAEVRPKLASAISAMEKQIRESEEISDQMKKLDSADLIDKEQQADSLQNKLNELEISNDVFEFASRDARSLTDQKQEVADQIQKGKTECAKAQLLRREAEELHLQSLGIINKVARDIAKVQQKLDSTILGWYMDSENSMAIQARSKAENALALEKKSAALMRDALDSSKKAKDAFQTADSLGRKLFKKSDNVIKMAQKQAEAARIEEENQRRSVAFSAEINSLTDSINALNHQKFLPNGFVTLTKEIANFQKLFNRKNFVETATLGENLVKQLRSFEQRATALQNAFEAAQIAAQNSLTAANREINTWDQNELARWTCADQAIAEAYARRNQANDLIQREMFPEAQEMIAQTLNELRNFALLAEKNKSNAEQRNELAEVIMNALYEQGYDAPTYYYSAQNPNGSDVEISDLTIFAKAPGVRGDMRMNIDLQGKVNLEVEGIAEGEETVCHQLIQDLQKGINQEIDFNMTDWGRAANVDANAKVTLRQQEKTQEKIRERQND